MKPTLLLKLLALAAENDGPEAWINQCVQAAEEATHAIAETDLVPPSTISQALANFERIPEPAISKGRWETQYVLAVAKAYADGVLTCAGSVTEGAAMAYRANMPPMRSRSQVQCFVACVAVGVLRGYISTRDANVLLYGAQAALSAFPKRKSSPRKIGFQQ